MTKMTRAERRARRQERKRKAQEVVEAVDPSERAFEQVIAQERTEEKNAEGYHFIRPAWHRWVYGGGKKER